MANEETGLYAEARRRAQYYANQNETLRKKILGPAANGARAETVNPFDKPAKLPVHPRPPFWKDRSKDHVQRRKQQRSGTCDDLDVTPLRIVQAVCNLAHLTAGKLMHAPGRKPEAVRPRQVAMFFIARYCGDLSLSQIGYIFAMHHATVLHAVEVVTKRLAEGCTQTTAMVEEVEAMLRAVK